MILCLYNHSLGKRFSSFVWGDKIEQDKSGQITGLTRENKKLSNSGTEVVKTVKKVVKWNGNRSLEVITLKTLLSQVVELSMDKASLGGLAPTI